MNPQNTQNTTKTIKKLSFKNIQSWKRGELSFSPGFNAIIGNSDQGKSAIINALLWCILNKPSGDQHRSHWGGKMESQIELSTGEIICLSKTKSKSEYSLTAPQGEPKKFTAFGRNVPQEIATVFNIDPKINTQRQLEPKAPIFLISESPGDVAKFFNRVAGLFSIDKTKANGKSYVKKALQLLGNLRQEKKEKKKELSQYEGVEERLQLITDLEHLQEQTQSKKEQVDQISKITQNIKVLQKQVQPLSKKIKAKKTIQNALVVLEKIQNYQEKKEQIEKHLKMVQRSIDFLPQIDSKLKGGFLVERAFSILGGIDSVQESKNRLKNKLEKVQIYEGKKQRTQDQLSQIKEKYQEMKPSICPLCGAPWGGDLGNHSKSRREKDV